MDNEKKPRAIIYGGGLGGGMARMMALVAASAGCSIEFGGPGPAPMNPHPSGRWSGRNINPTQMPRSRTLLPMQLPLGAVEHTTSPKPLTKRQKRRAKGKQRTT